MEGVGARFGRSSTRYGPATVFNGPVRRWKKKWVHVSPSSTTNTNHSRNGTCSTYASNRSHLKLFKWTPISQTSDATTADKDDDAGSAPPPPEEPPRRKFKYIPVAVLEEQKNEDAENEAAEKAEEEAKQFNTGPSGMEPSLNRSAMEEKPDMNDVPIENNEVEDNNQSVRQDLNESTLDLSLG